MVFVMMPRAYARRQRILVHGSRVHTTYTTAFAAMH
jgi:hypothetical protein